MKITNRIGLLASATLLCAGLLAAPMSNAGETTISIRYAGVGWVTHVDGFVPDGMNVDLTTGTGQGTFGNSDITITTEFVPYPGLSCPDGYTNKYALVYSATVLTMRDQSQLYGISQEGWICATAEGRYFGEVKGVYAGGTGRFATATGEFVSKFDGAYLEPNLSFRSIRGTVAGSVGTR
jgi:hypothetical protein